MTKVKVFYGRRRRRGHDNSSPYFRHGELKNILAIAKIDFDDRLYSYG